MAFIHTEADLDAGLAALIAADPRFAPLLDATGKPPLRRREGGYAGLVQIVCAQQLSTASAAAIYGRLMTAFDPLDHHAIRGARSDRLRRAGLSMPKIRALKAIGTAIHKGRLDLDALANGGADDAHAALTAVHGIGPWTADIYLLACLGHSDAWPAGDLALQEAARIAFSLKRRPTTKEMGPLADAWRPWRAVAARLLWSYYRHAKGREGMVAQQRQPVKDSGEASEETGGNGGEEKENVMAELDGPRLEPRSRQARQLVVFLHGYGADGNDLIEIGRAWQPLLPDAAFVSPHAPEPCAQAPVGRQWFGLTMRDPGERWRGVNKAAPVLQNFLDAELKRRNLPPGALALVGFSQGTMMSLHVGLRRAVAPAAIVGYSGTLALPNEDKPEDAAGGVTSRPPVLLVHGDRDELIPVQALFMTAQGLAALDVPAEWHISPGIGHGIDGEGLRHGGEFLARRFMSMKPSLA